MDNGGTAKSMDSEDTPSPTPISTKESSWTATGSAKGNTRGPTAAFMTGSGKETK